MEFRPNPPSSNPPKNLFPCLATITLGPPNSTTSTSNSGRRLSSSALSDDGSGMDLKRVISGNRRKTSFGQAAVRGDDGPQRKSFDSTSGGGAGGGGADAHERGTWYWRVQVGVSESHLYLLPLSQPANALLTTKPAPLSDVMPSHSTNDHSTSHGKEGGESIGDKIKNLFTGGSHKKEHATGAGTDHGTGVGAGTGAGAGASETIADQTPSGEPRGDVHAEQGWPGVVQGHKLGSVVVPLHHVVPQGVQLGSGKKGESWVVVPINAGIPSIGQTSESAPKSGTIKFEFDKDWIGAKGEAEVLHHQIVSALQNPQPGAASHSSANANSNAAAGGGGGAFVNQNYQLGGGHAVPVTAAQGQGVGAGAGYDADVGPDESVSSGRSGKVAGGY